ncbi:MAG TPA: preprotein translocase subunit SecA [Gemmataceae bacterium]|nr:preprotein translocase subunit SecA [Gemmataceae bacterium]
MAKEPAAGNEFLEIVWDQLTDKMNAFSEWGAKALLRLFGDSNERTIRKLGYVRNADGSHTATPGHILAQVNELEPKMRALSDDELKAVTPKLREKLAQGATLDDLLPEAFAACREAGRRTKNMRHFDVQILGGAVLHEGNIAEMVTGEGKTLVATLPAYLNALEGKGVHIVTVNDYLARRDCEWMLPIYRALGITAGPIQSDMDPVARREAYDCDITYGTNSEFGFDYLRDNMKPARWGDPAYYPFQQQCQKNLNFAIIDEVDNILIDEARTPLIISGQAFSDLRRYTRANDVAVQLTEMQKADPGRYFEVKEKERTCHLTDEGVRKAEELAGVESFYTAGNMEWPHLIDNALKAHHLYHRDKNYAVIRLQDSNDLCIVIIDEFTGRLMWGRQWSDGLHQAVEAKHARDGVKIKEETQTLATITIQNYFKLYKKLSGMTGTAMTEANEFWKIYKLDVIAIPTNKPLIRINSPDVIFRTEKEKWKAAVEEILEVQASGRPVLIGTTDVDKSLKLSEMLKRRGIKHELLNALPEHAAREAEIVAQAGRLGAVTIATNMAGRGTDIILGGNPETLAWARLKDKYPTRLDVPEDEWKRTVDEIEQREKMKEEGRQVAALGGLHIVGTERHEARRIDNQLRGRAGRQGDPGSSRFFLSLEDDLMRIFAGEWVANVLTKLGMEEGQAIESKMVSRRIEAAQKKVEERNFDIRKNLLEYDEVMDHQRKKVYGYRQEILDGANCKVRMLEMLDGVVDAAVDRFLDDDYGPACFAEFASNRLGVEFDAADFSRSDYAEAENTARTKASRMVPTQVQEFLEENLGSEDQSEWNWQALSGQVNARWGLKTTERQLRGIDQEDRAQFIIEKAEKAVDEVDLEPGRPYLDDNWGVQSVCDWARLKFQLPLTVEELKGKTEAQVKDLLHGKVRELYRQKEIEFPVQVGLARFMADRAERGGAAQRYDREGLYRWAAERFPGLVVAGPSRDGPAANGLPGDQPVQLTEEDFRTQSRARLRELLLKASLQRYPQRSEEEIDARLEDAFQGTKLSEAEDARELAEWMRAEMGVEVPAEQLTGVTQDQARQVLWNAYDARYRPEMRTMERSLLLHQLDSSWKNHLYTMDHLRSIVGLRGYAQLDAKTEYKREGMLEFDRMWEGLQEKVSDTVFRMEEAEGFQESLWNIGATIHEAAPRAMAQPANAQEEAIANSGKGEKKPEPIRNKGQRVGRNDPCPCGSGKKYKNCHMREESGVRR